MLNAKNSGKYGFSNDTFKTLLMCVFICCVCFEQIQKLASYKIAAVRSLTSNLTNHLSMTNWRSKGKFISNVLLWTPTRVHNSKSLHSLGFCWHWIPCRALTKADRDGWLKCQKNPCCWHSLMMMMIIIMCVCVCVCVLYPRYQTNRLSIL